jgi:hypothetical protein
MQLLTGQPTIDLSKLEVATFEGYEEFDHFANFECPGCFACNSKLMLVRPIAVTDEFILLVATTALGNGSFVIIPDTWLVYPRKHLTTLIDMPNNWTGCVKQAVAILGIDQPYCTGENWGRLAGQTVDHGHTWVMKRNVGEEGFLTERIGLATILLRVKMHGICAP